MNTYTFESLANQIARCVAYSQLEGASTSEIMAKVYVLVSDATVFVDLDRPGDLESAVIDGLDFASGRVTDLEKFLSSAMARFEWIERSAIRDLEKAVAIERFAPGDDREAAHEVAALRQRAIRRLQDIDIPLADRKIMVKADPDTIEALRFKFENATDPDKLWISTEFRANPTGQIAVILYPSEMQATVISAISSMTQEPFELLEDRVTSCALSLPGYADGRSYQFASDQNRALTKDVCTTVAA